MNADYQATEKLNMTFGVIFNDAEGYMDDISLSAPFAPAGGALAGFYNPGATPGPPATPVVSSGWEARIPLVENYSDLEYQQIEVSLGGTYSFTDRLYTTAMATYSDFDAKEDYVYGDESGSAYYGYLGVGYRF